MIDLVFTPNALIEELKAAASKDAIVTRLECSNLRCKLHWTGGEPEWTLESDPITGSVSNEVQVTFRNSTGVEVKASTKDEIRKALEVVFVLTSVYL